MLSRELALALRDAGLAWKPAKGDQFFVPDRDLDNDVFVLSDMVIEVVEDVEGPTILAFNGTTEWALDSVDADAAIWLPREDQLRGRLGDAFAGLERIGEPVDGYVVTLGVRDGDRRLADVTAANAYARALLAVLAGDA